MLSRYKYSIDRWLRMPVDWLIGHGITPNVLTIMGLGSGVIASVVIAVGFFVIGGILILLAGFVDVLDGAVARRGHATSNFGATIDSISDRYVDSFLLLGLGIAGVNWVYVGVALMGSLLVSYVRAKAEVLKIPCTAGIAERSERLIILALGLLSGLIGYVELAVILVAILAQFTALWRIGLLLRRTVP
ncbi:MAG: CDP-alcohol phosphatidyltransferase family protein [Halobacteriota archaeon]